MPQYCNVFQCHSTREKGFKLFVFPSALKEPSKRQIWIKKVNRKGWLPREHSLICERHFVDGEPTECHPYSDQFMEYNCPAAKSRKPPLQRAVPKSDVPRPVKVVVSNVNLPSTPVREDTGKRLFVETPESKKSLPTSKVFVADHDYKLPRPSLVRLPLRNSFEDVRACPSAPPVFLTAVCGNPYEVESNLSFGEADLSDWTDYDSKEENRVPPRLDHALKKQKYPTSLSPIVERYIRREFVKLGGNIVFVSSITGFVPFQGIAAYGVTKTALLGLIKALSISCGQMNIRVNGVAPGIIKTDFSKAMWENEASSKFYQDSVPLGRMGTPDDCSGIVSFLCSDQASYITGETVMVTGGIAARL